MFDFILVYLTSDFTEWPSNCCEKYETTEVKQPESIPYVKRANRIKNSIVNRKEVETFDRMLER